MADTGHLLLGIDTGGTYTDSVLFSPDSGVRAASKAVTTRRDLSIGIRESVSPLLKKGASGIGMVSLSTTLATNAVVEGKGSPICLILIGYPADALERSNLKEALGDDPVVFISGGHDASGNQKLPFDTEAAREAVLSYRDTVSAFAVSGYFSVRNPSHESQAAEMVRELTGLPVTTGRELSSKLNAPKRAVTAALNARLVPVLEQLIQAVRKVLLDFGIRAPLMVVKGDGSLMRDTYAEAHPIETILSGPAASVVGARYLTGSKRGLVSDMGGTTTDIAVMRRGTPVIDPDGAVIGGWQTMVEAVKIHTFGLGGDSRIDFRPPGIVTIGPDRIVPVCLAAVDFPKVLPLLEDLPEKSAEFPLIILPAAVPDALPDDLTRRQRTVLSEIQNGPKLINFFYSMVDSPSLLIRDLNRLADRGMVSYAGFTPTDACHILGIQETWNTRASILTAGRILHYAGLRGVPSGSPEELAQGVRKAVINRSIQVLVSASVADEYGFELEQNPKAACMFGYTGIPHSAFPTKKTGSSVQNGNTQKTSLVTVRSSLNVPLIALGAPVSSYYPGCAEHLETKLLIPEYAEVANAIGAVAGNVLQHTTVHVVNMEDGEYYRLHHEEGIEDFESLEDAVSAGTKFALASARKKAEEAGAREIHTEIDRKDNNALGHGREIHVSTAITVTAAGRPAVSER